MNSDVYTSEQFNQEGLTMSDATIDTFLDDCLTTEVSDYNKVVERFTPSVARLLHAGLLMSGEGAEFNDAIKKHLMYGKALDITNLKEEVGDVLYGVAVACAELRIDIEDAMRLEINKLKVRYPDKYSDEAALNRDLFAERKVLEDE